MISLVELQEMFEKVQEEENSDNLNEHKFNLQIEENKLHVRLHEPNLLPEDKSNLIAVIKTATLLRGILNSRIENLKEEKGQKRKELNRNNQNELHNDAKMFRKFNIEESNLALAAKRLLDKHTYQALIKCAQEMKHSEINKLKQKDLKSLIEK